MPLVIAGDRRPVSTSITAGWPRLVRAAAPRRRTSDADEHQRNVALTDAGFRRAQAALRCGPLARVRPAPDARRHPRRAARRGAAPARPRLHRPQRPHRTGRRVHRARGRQPAMAARHPARGRGQGGRRGPARRDVLGSIPIQHFVRLWPRARRHDRHRRARRRRSSREFYGLTTVVFPPHRPCLRVDEPDVVFTHREAKTAALARRDRARARGGPPGAGRHGERGASPRTLGGAAARSPASSAAC